jgi:hypothetical protein
MKDSQRKAIWAKKNRQGARLHKPHKIRESHKFKFGGKDYSDPNNPGHYIGKKGICPGCKGELHTDPIVGGHTCNACGINFRK